MLQHFLKQFTCTRLNLFAFIRVPNFLDILEQIFYNLFVSTHTHKNFVGYVIAKECSD